MWQGHVFEVCERISEAQSILHEHKNAKLSDAEALEKLKALLSEQGLLDAMYYIGYFPKQAREL